MDNFNIDKNTMDKVNSMLNNGNLNDLLAQIPPDTMKNFSQMFNNMQTSNPSEINNANNIENNSQYNSQSNSQYISQNNTNSYDKNINNSSQTNNSFDFNNIDINTLMRMKSIMEKMNSNSNPSSNLLQSLKPYLRDEKKYKVDQYSKLLNMTNIMELFNQSNNNKTENSSD